MNKNPNLRSNPITQSVNELAAYISREKHGRSDDEDSDDDIRPFQRFAKPLTNYKTFNNRLLQLISEHIDEALQTGFDDSIAKYKGKSHFVVSPLQLFAINHKFLLNKFS